MGGGVKEIRQVFRGRKEVREILERHTESDIERGEKARNRYRTDISNLDRAAEESSKVNNSLRNELKPWSKEASTMMMMMRKRTNKVRRNKMAKLIKKYSLPPNHPLFSRGFSITPLRKPMKPTEEIEETEEDTEEKKTPESDNPSNKKE